MLKINSISIKIDENYVVLSQVKKCKERIKELRESWTIGDVAMLIDDGMGVHIGEILKLDIEVCCNSHEEPVFWFYFKSFDGIKFYSGLCVCDLDRNIHRQVSEIKEYKRS